MKALVYVNDLSRLAATKLLGSLFPRAFVGPLAPLQLREIPDPELPAPDWLTIRTRLCGLCGSDYKQVFMNGAIDNPMTALISFPQVLGHEVVGTARDGQAGVQQYEALHPDVVILDLIMPRMNGREALREIRSRDPQATVVIASSMRSPRSALDCERDGAAFFLYKPLDEGDMRNVIRKLQPKLDSGGESNTRP